MEIDKINNLWESFFFPVLNTMFIILSLYIILGKDECGHLWTSLGKRIDSIVFSKQKKEKYSSQPKIFGVLKKSIQEALKKPATWIFVCFLLSFGINKLIFYHANNVFPLRYYFNREAMAVKIVDINTMTELWARNLGLSFSTLCSKISETGQNAPYVKYHDSSVTINLLLVVEFICSFGFVASIVLGVKKKWKRCMRALVVMLISLFFVIFLSFTRYLSEREVFQQSAYYTLQVESIENQESIEQEVYDEASKKTKEEYELWKTYNDGFFEGFGLKLRLPFH